MKFASISMNENSEQFLALVEGEVFFPIKQYTNVTDALVAGVDLHELGNAAKSGEAVSGADVTVHSPLKPAGIRDCMTFHEHIRNCRPDGFDERNNRYPAFYISNQNAVVGPYDDVQISPGSEQFDFELEVCAVLGKDITNPTPAEAEAAIAGYTIFIDWSARDVQMDEMTSGLGPGKGKDGATSLGPYFVTADEFESRKSNLTYDISMQAYLNGELITDGNMNTMNWSFGDVISYAARGTTLSTGEVLGSGTVGTGCLYEHFKTGSPIFKDWLRPGDVVEMKVDLMGSTKQEIQAAMPLHLLSSGY